MTAISTLIETYGAAAERAETEEAAFRREAARRIGELERERAFAYRRANLMRSLADITAGAEDAAMAAAAAQALLRARLGWGEDDAARSEILTRFGAVGAAMHALATGGEAGDADVAGELGRFEAWYAETFARAFWVSFETPPLDTPLVDF